MRKCLSQNFNSCVCLTVSILYFFLKMWPLWRFSPPSHCPSFIGTLLDFLLPCFQKSSHYPHVYIPVPYWNAVRRWTLNKPYCHHDHESFSLDPSAVFWLARMDSIDSRPSFGDEGFAQEWDRQIWMAMSGFTAHVLDVDCMCLCVCSQLLQQNGLNVLRSTSSS